MDQSTESLDFPVVAVGRERFKADRRQLGGLMLLLATCATFQPLAEITSFIGTDETGANTALEKSALVSGLFQVVFGSLGMCVGYLNLVHDYGNYKLSGALILLTQFAWMPFITGLANVGKSASSPYLVETRRSIFNGVIILEDYISNPFIPEDYLPTKRDVRFFGAMGILGIVCYGVALLGSLAFTEFAIYAFDVGKPMARDAPYYRGRLLFYTFVLVIAGVSQLLLGGYILFEFGNGPLRPSMGVAMYRVHYPEITVTIGSLQMLAGYYGIARYLAFVPIGPPDNEFQILLAIQWISMLVLQYIVQIGYGYDSDSESAAATTLSLLSVALNVLPAFLDYKMRTVPHLVNGDYYGIPSRDKSESSERPPSGFERLASENSYRGSDRAEEDLEAGKPDSIAMTPSGRGEERGVPDSDINSTDELFVLENVKEKQAPFVPPPPLTRDFLDIIDNEEEEIEQSGKVLEPSEHIGGQPVEYSKQQQEPSEHLGSRTISNDQMNQLYEASTEPSSNKSRDRDRDEVWGGDNNFEMPLNDLPETVATDGLDVSSRDQSSTMSSAGLSEDTSGAPSADDIENSTRSIDSPSDDSEQNQSDNKRSLEADAIISTDGSADNSSGSGGVGKDPPKSTLTNDEIIDNLLLEFSRKDFVDADKGLPLNSSRMDSTDADGSCDEYISIHEEEDSSSSESDYASNDQMPSDSDDTSDDSTAVLEQKLEEIENELFTDSMESFRKSLTEMF